MIAKVKPGSQKALVEAGKQWEADRKVDGFQGEYTLLGEDGVTVVSCVTFESKEKYLALADDPAQDTWYQEKLRPLLTEDPQWIDGNWAD